MNEEQVGSAEFPIGLYKDPESGTYVGALDPTQANAFVHVGFKLFKEGREAASMSDEEIANIDNRSSDQPEFNAKKGK